MSDTLARSAKEVAGFAVIFFIVFAGFAQSYTIVFHGRIAQFRTTMQSMFALVRGLLGDFDFVELQENAPFMGPVLFISFTTLASFVVLNMLIAIISEQYELSAAKYRAVHQAHHLHEEIGKFVVKQIWRTPLLGGMLKTGERLWKRR